MAIFLATILLLVGLGWSFFCFLSLSMHPTPSQADVGLDIWLGPVVALAGILWWGWIIWGWP